MGHDISAYRSQRDADEWSHEVAYLRRSAFNPLNQVIYIALDVMSDKYDLYGGVSGRGACHEFTYDDINQARLILDNLDFSFLLSDRADHPAQAATKKALAIMFGAVQDDVESAKMIMPDSAPMTVDVEPERQFIARCLDGMTELNTVFITFS